MTIDFKQLCIDSHQISVDKGWQETERSYDEDTILFHSELSEALEDYRKNLMLNEVYYEYSSDGVKNPKTYTSEEWAAHQKEHGVDPYNHAKPCGIPIELADFIIRLCQFCGTHKRDLAYAVRMVDVALAKNLPQLLARCHRDVSEAYDYWSFSEGYNENILSKAAKRVVLFCEENQIDLEAAIKLKEAYNRTRPHKHGGKKI